MDSVELALIAGGLAVIVLAIIIVFVRPNLGGDYRRSIDDDRYGTSGSTGGGGDGD